MEAALGFISAFPDCRAFHFTVLSQDKTQCLLNKPSLAREDVPASMEAWLKLSRVHIFVRPQLGNVIFLDLDAWAGQWDTLVKLQPRAIVETSPQHYQCWLTMPDTLAPKTAKWAQDQLVRALSADPKANSVSQQGRLPGSQNCKPGKNHTVALLHRSVQDLSDEVLLTLVPKEPFRIVGDKLRPARPPAEPLDPDGSRATIDHSAADWRMVCSYFEKNSAATQADALTALQGQWQAKRPNMDYYAKITVSKAFQHCRKKVFPGASTAAAASSSSHSGVTGGARADQAGQGQIVTLTVAPIAVIFFRHILLLCHGIGCVYFPRGYYYFSPCSV